MTDVSKWNEMFLRNSAGSDITFLDCLFDVFTFWKQHTDTLRGLNRYNLTKDGVTVMQR
jgi:hypothetical protein